jgi:hypothetical protein
MFDNYFLSLLLYQLSPPQNKGMETVIKIKLKIENIGVVLTEMSRFLLSEFSL